MTQQEFNKVKMFLKNKVANEILRTQKELEVMKERYLEDFEQFLKFDAQKQIALEYYLPYAKSLLDEGITDNEKETRSRIEAAMEDMNNKMWESSAFSMTSAQTIIFCGKCDAYRLFGNFLKECIRPFSDDDFRYRIINY